MSSKGCFNCVHAIKVKMEDLRGKYTLRCGVTRRFLESPKTRCKDFEPETWERFSGKKTEGDVNED